MSEPLVAQLAGRTVPYVLKRSVRRRRAVLNVDEYGLTVHVPWRASRTAIERFVQDSAAWILKKLEEWSRFPPRRQRWMDGERIEYVGQSLQLELLVGGAVAQVRLAGPGQLQICLPAPSEAAARTAAVNWYRRHARLNFQSRLAHFVELMRVRTPRLILSSARTRWGSCNSNGEVRLNWRLIQAPQMVIDYVVVHELSHIREMNHSRRFWRLVEQACPEHAQARAHLEERGRWYLAV